jgi:catechol 2,3-dioxygenase-like lactoylglutathione lyase family enzyme
MSGDGAKTPVRGIPGLRGTDHIGFTVPNLEQAIEFFVDVIGCEPFYELGPFQADDDWMAAHLNVHPRAVMRRLKFLRCGAGSNFELFEYESPESSRAIAMSEAIIWPSMWTTSARRSPICGGGTCASSASRPSGPRGRALDRSGSIS